MKALDTLNHLTLEHALHLSRLHALRVRSDLREMNDAEVTSELASIEASLDNLRGRLSTLNMLSTAYELPDAEAADIIPPLSRSAAHTALAVASSELSVSPSLRWLLWGESYWLKGRALSPIRVEPDYDLFGQARGGVIWIAIESRAGRGYSPARIAITVLHEARHVWQYQTGFEGDFEGDAEGWARDIDRAHVWWEEVT